ncbi:hypothetical protein P1X15_25990 [Runella sp. MFBS21]|jgi:uncharacterized membrane protein|uniref:hypothetical protein n=1 Tax=Runella TaxID=105 RepID=UPI00041A0685|nr:MULTISPECIES: hypothetical protein [Runella]MDF7821102.1 hypothetical protein [Runella sp. MFBS21]
MEIATFGIRAWRILSMIAVFGASIYSYSLFGADVGVHFDASGKPDEFMTKSDVFYILVALILINNVLLVAFGRQLLKLPSHMLPIPNQAEWSLEREKLNEHLQNWVYCLVALINTFIAMTVWALATVNNEFKYKIKDFEGLFYVVIASLLIVIISLPIRLMIKPQIEEQS